MPERIQLRRTKGWRKPEGAVVVSRPSTYGNPFQFRQRILMKMEQPEQRTIGRIRVLDNRTAVMLFRLWVEQAIRDGAYPIHRLRGKDLCCWCPIDKVCHADVLLELANP